MRSQRGVEMDNKQCFDTIVVGSGNGACGYLSYVLRHGEPTEKILVIERGDSFFETSDITHQVNWTKSYAEGNIFKLHNAQTPDGRPIISGWACTMGGGGSINYTMIHESDEWLAQHIGRDADYWHDLKQDLNQLFERPDPSERETGLTKHILASGEASGFAPASVTHRIANIPSYQDIRQGPGKQLYQFPTQFNYFGQRTNSGVSLVEWEGDRVQLITHCRVDSLEFESLDSVESRCKTVRVTYLETGDSDSFELTQNGRLLLCSGAATPRLLFPHKDTLGNAEIGQHVSDHIVLPLGIYLPDVDVTPEDLYAPVFATTVWQPSGDPSNNTANTEDPDNGQDRGRATVCCFDFFAGRFEKLLFIIAHLYLAFLLPNWLKRFVIRTPWLFTIAKNTVRILIQILNFFINLGAGIDDLLHGKPWHWEGVNLVTAIVKFNPATEGAYLDQQNKIELGFFSPKGQFEQDKTVAISAITDQLEFLERLGKKPPRIVQWIFRLFTRIPYEPHQVEGYVNVYSRKFLLSEQHLAGGCLLGAAIDRGDREPERTGRVRGTSNVHVADLSATPLPRLSPQMTAYAIGFHVAKQLYGQGTAAIVNTTKTATPQQSQPESTIAMAEEGRVRTLG